MKFPNPLAYPLYSIAALILAAGLGYQLFLLIDGQFLARRSAVTKVLGHEFKPSSQGTYTTKVGSSVRSYPITLPPAWLILVEVDGQQGKKEVPHFDYLALKDGEDVRVIYSRKRIRKALTIHEIRKMEDK